MYILDKDNSSQFLKLGKFVDSITIGINLWLIPQISEHWPKYKPGRFMNSIVWFRRPGVESILIPREGTVQAWITSIEVVKIRIGNLNGKIQRLSTSKSRNSWDVSWLEGIIKESNSREEKSEYSYLQYHWWPIDLIESLLLWISSVRYKIFSDGIAIKIKINIGMIVQINSMVCPWRRNRSVSLFIVIEIMINRINKVIKIKIIIVKSWKKIIISYVGEFEFCRDKSQVLIFNKRCDKSL